MSYIKMTRESQTLDYILKERPTAFCLLALIAKRAKRTNDHPDKRLEIGEAYIGDFDTYGVTEQIYRTDKSFLKSTNQITTRTTNKGTIARLVNTDCFDINEEQKTNKTTDKLTGHQRTTNGQLTTNNNVKNDKNDKETEIRQILDKEVISLVGRKFRIASSDVEGQVETLIDYCLANNKTYKDYPAALRNFVTRAIQDKKIKTEIQALQDENPDIPDIASRII